MLDTLVSTLSTVLAPLAQVGFAAAAWRMCSALKSRVDDHEIRLKVVEKTEA